MKADIVLYNHLNDSNFQIEVKVEDETVWLTQAQMVQLFEASKQNISLHINNVFKEGELQRNSVVKDSLTTASDGKNIISMFFYIYVLRSLNDKKFYTGYTSNLERRLEKHNKGLIHSTKHRIPLDLVYFEGCLNQQDATKREKYLKTTYGKRYLKNRMVNYLDSIPQG